MNITLSLLYYETPIWIKQRVSRTDDPAPLLLQMKCSRSRPGILIIIFAGNNKQLPPRTRPHSHLPRECEL